MNPIKSIYYHYLNFKLSHFTITKEGHALRRLKNIHSGCRCFIVGNGPSLRADDLEKITRNHDISFACNRIYHIFEKTSWRPQYYISQDERMLRGCQEEVNQIPCKLKFIPAELAWYSDININNALLYHLTYDRECQPDFSEDIASCIENSKTVVYTAIQIAVYMGIREIYLIGVDHHFHISQNSKNEILIDNTVRNYFTEEYDSDREKLEIPNLEVSTLTYVAAKEYADANGIHIYNATRGGKLDVFERRNFDDLFGK